MQSTAISSALQTAGYRAFDFDLVDAVKDMHSKELVLRVLSRVGFACDAYINIAVQRAMTALRAEAELAGTPQWDSYQAFLSYAAGIAASEETMREAGMEVTPLRETVQKLFNVRTAVHAVCHELVGESYKVPVITEWMCNPRIRRDDASTMAKLKGTFKMMATNDDGVIDVDLEKQMAESYAVKATAQKQDQLKWDKQRGELAAMMFNALKIRDDIADVGYADEFDPFGDLDAELQYKLLNGALRYITDSLTDMAVDRKIRFEDHAAAVIESRPVVKAVKLAIEHPKFAKIDA